MERHLFGEAFARSDATELGELHGAGEKRGALLDARIDQLPRYPAPENA